MSPSLTKLKGIEIIIESQNISFSVKPFACKSCVKEANKIFWKNN
jgi:hypothetical protein